jgi:hypothetical protein
MTIGQAIGFLTGGNPGMGMQLITLGQISNLAKAISTGKDYIVPLREILNAPQDPNGWTSHRTFKASELCQDCTVLSVKSDIVYENGTRADVSRGLYLHHTASLNIGLHMNVIGSECVQTAIQLGMESICKTFCPVKSQAVVSYRSEALTSTVTKVSSCHIL